MRYFTADTHFAHTNIIGYVHRPFFNADQMDEQMLATWNDTVHDNDEIYVVGDLALGRLEESLETAALLNGHKILIPGNHDKCWTGKKKSEQSRSMYLDAGFTIIDAPHTLRLGTHEVLLHHFPYPGAGDAMTSETKGYKDKFAANRPTDHGQWLIHGHVHDRWRQRGRMINVGIDAWGGRLVTDEDIVHLISQGPNNLDVLPWE
jgi:calcineurin-like phosphoesterase family protein